MEKTVSLPAFGTDDTDILNEDLTALSLTTIDGNPFRKRAAAPRSAPTSPPLKQSRSPPPVGHGPLVLAIDYGTTRTGVAFAVGNRIEVLQNWGSGMTNELKVRSAISYVNRGETQWGFAIDDDRVAMVNTKLELEPQGSRFDELDLTLHVLKGVGFLRKRHMIEKGPSPAYSPKSPVEIVKDYLEKVYRQAMVEIDKTYDLHSTKIPIDIVLTIPVDWSYEAQDSVFKAVRGAGFNKASFPTLQDTILVSEPEAASYFTAKDLRDNDKECFKEDDCFVLCDAGGGTVDVVSFQVKQLRPDLVLEKITKARGDKVGSALIDTNFKVWLRDLIGEGHYAKIDAPNANKNQRISPHAAEGGFMRELIGKFNLEKHMFSKNSTRDIIIDLPEPLADISIAEHINQGALTIKRKEMMALMDPCVSGVIALIKDQLEKVIDARGQRVWNVLLVGGFGASPYLQRQLKRSLKFRRPPVGLHVPKEDSQTTAVVQGAVIYGLEKIRHKDATYLAAITKSYGVVYDEKFFWFSRKDDLARPRTTESEPFHHAPLPGYSAGQLDEFTIYTYNARTDKDDIVPYTWREGYGEVTPVVSIKVDLLRHRSPLVGGYDPTHRSVGPLKWKFRLLNTHWVEVELIYTTTGEQLGHTRFKLDTDAPSPRDSQAMSPRQDEDQNW